MSECPLNGEAVSLTGEAGEGVVLCHDLYITSFLTEEVVY